MLQGVRSWARPLRVIRRVINNAMPHIALSRMRTTRQWIRERRNDVWQRRTVLNALNQAEEARSRVHLDSLGGMESDVF